MRYAISPALQQDNDNEEGVEKDVQYEEESAKDKQEHAED